MAHWRNAVCQEVYDWIHAPLSEENRMFRLRAMGTAFGLQEHYLMKRYMPDPTAEHYQGMGNLLELEILGWVRLHPNLQMNDPEFHMTDWADLGE